MRRLTCLLRGHRWSDWHTGGYLLPADDYLRHGGKENRVCFRCPKNQYRTEETH